MNRLRIRDASQDDAPALAALLVELGYEVTAPVVSERLARLIAGGEVVLVAEREGEPLGLLTLHVMPVLHRPTAVGRLSVLVVAAKARGQGIGRALVEAGERRLVDRGCALVEVTSGFRLEGAHAFYRRIGYEETSLRFKKDLAPRGAGP